MEAPTGSSMGDSEFEVSWTVTIAGSQKSVNVTVEPQVSNELTPNLSHPFNNLDDSPGAGWISPVSRTCS